jgi:hypothetical protein
MKEKTPEWLINIQNNSWSPEIFISGMTITFIFLINDNIINFFAMLIQQIGAEVTARIMFYIFIHCVNIIKVALIFHLLLRGLWAALVGLSYVYPEGIRKEKLPKQARHVEFDKPVDLVLNVEKICSLSFSVIYIFIFVMLMVSLLYTPLIIIESLMLENYFILYFGYLIFVFVVLLAAIFLSKTLFVTKLMNNLFNNIVYTFSTNAGNKLSFALFGVMILVSIPISRTQTGAFEFDNSAKIKIDSLNPQLINDHYITLRNNEIRISKAAIDAFELEKNYPELLISEYKADEVTIEKIISRYDEIIKLGFKIDTSNFNMSDLHQIYIDSILIPDLKIFRVKNHVTGQEGLKSLLPIEGLNVGYHTIVINKLIWNRLFHEFRVVKNWDQIPFYKSKA